MGVTRRLRFLRNVSDADLVLLYNAASLFVFPSRYEGFGLPLLEAMACGTPVVAADNSSIPEIAGEAARLVNAEDPAAMTQAIAAVLADDGLRAGMSRRGLAQAARFSWARCARETRDVYTRSGHAGRAAEQERGGMEKPRILFLAHLLPYPLDGGAKIKSYYTLRKLAEQYEVTLLAFVRSEDEKKNIVPLRELCQGGIETVIIHRSKVKNVVDAARLLPGAQAVHRRAATTSARWRRPCRRGWASAATTPSTLTTCRWPSTCCPANRWRSWCWTTTTSRARSSSAWAETTPSKAMRWYASKEAPKLEQYELDVCRAMDRVLVVSGEDAQTLRKLAPDLKNLTVVPIGVDTDFFQPAPRYEDPKTRAVHRHDVLAAQRRVHRLVLPQRLPARSRRRCPT